MSSLLSLAWRNLGRNLRRSMITGAALAFGMALCIATFGLTDGLNVQMIHSLTRFDLGHLQVHNEKYVQDPQSMERIAKPARVLRLLDGLPGVRAAPRLYGFGLVSGEGKSSGVQLVGIDPARERHVTEFQNRMLKGSYLKNEPTPWPEARRLTAAESKRDAELTREATHRAELELDSLAPLGRQPGEADDTPRAASRTKDPSAPTADERALLKAQEPMPERPPLIMLGRDLARVLHVDVGERLFVSVATVDGAMNSIFVKVGGIYRTGTTLHDRHRAMLHIADLRRLLHAGEQAHEVSISLDDPERAPELQATLAPKLDPGLEVRTWREIRPDVARMVELNDMSSAIMTFIIFFVATLGVVNTMLMAVFERTREIGMLKAIGMAERRIVLLILTESLLLVLVSSLVGVLGGLAIDGYFVVEGLDLRHLTAGFSMGGLGIDPVVRGAITQKGIVTPIILLGVTCLIASIYPALRAARLQPAVGMRET